MSKLTSDLQLIMRAGGSVSIPSNKTTEDLRQIARAGRSKGATLIVRNAGSKTTEDLQSISRAHPGHVLFEFD